MAEQYFNLFSTTVAIGGYTAGAGVLNVASTSGITLAASATCRLLVYRVISGVITPIVLLKATAVNSSTQFAVTAEGSDANALVTDVVINVNSVGGENQIRIDQNRIITGALPTDGHQGDVLNPSDDNVRYVHDGSVFQPYGPVYSLVNPALTTFTWRNQGSATVTTRAGSIYLLAAAASGNSMKIREVTTPGTTPITYEVAFIPHAFNVNFNSIGPCFIDSVGGKVVSFIYTNSANLGPSIQVNYMTSVTAFSSTPVNAVGVYPGALIFMRMKDDGTNLIFSWSTNGIEYHIYTTLLRHAHLAAGPDKAGFSVDANNTTYPTGATLVHWKSF